MKNSTSLFSKVTFWIWISTYTLRRSKLRTIQIHLPTSCIMGVLASDLPYHSLLAVIITTITGSLSAISSCCLILVILRSQSKLNTVYHRITFGMSCADIMSSVAMALTTIPLPKSLPNDIIELEADFVDYDNWAGMKLGNVQTCSAQGFFFTFGILAMYVYNLMLCVYYVCALVFHTKEKLIIRRVEPALHMFPITLGLGRALNFLFFNAYNPNGWEAWCAPHSTSCDWSDEIQNVFVEEKESTSNSKLNWWYLFWWYLF